MSIKGVTIIILTLHVYSPFFKQLNLIPCKCSFNSDQRNLKKHTSQPVLNNTVLLIWTGLSAQKPDFCEYLE